MRTSFRALLTAFLLGGGVIGANAATFELATRTDGTIVAGVKVEGEIVPGDAQRLMDFYGKFGPQISPVYLRSKGGDVSEAMKMGEIIRRLRLETSAPVWDTGKPPIGRITADRPDDMICGSACFLVYAGGATRSGNYLALHRPFIPRDEARKLSDAEYEKAQKDMTPKVKAYLAEMEIDQYWIDRMFSANSQEYYIPTWNEADSKLHHLLGIVPSLEEVVLSKCNENHDADDNLRKVLNLARPLSSEDQEKLKQIFEESNIFVECKKNVLSDMQSAAFERENATTLNQACKQFSPLAANEISMLQDLIKKEKIITQEENVNRARLFERYDAYNNCMSNEKYNIRFATFKNWWGEVESKKHANRPATTDDFKANGANGLSPDAMAKKGKDAYDAENYKVALRWFKMAADLGNADGMMGMSWTYRNGRGVSQNDAEALRWLKMSAENGNSVAMWLVGADYEDGKVVPQDFAEAMRWYKKSADTGNADAMGRIGSLYADGLGVPQDYIEAMRWNKKSAEMGNTSAMFTVATFYLYGNGVPKDEAQARAWMKRAATKGDVGANMWLTDHPLSSR